MGVAHTAFLMRRVMKTGRAKHQGLFASNPISDNTAAEPAVGRAGATLPAPLERAIHGRCSAPKLSTYSATGGRSPQLAGLHCRGASSGLDRWALAAPKNFAVVRMPP